jgi:hypothetical protein
MKHLFDIIYYQTYLFYKSVLKEDDPHFATALGLGAATAFLIIFPFRVIKDIYTCYDFSTMTYFIFTMCIVGTISLYFSKNNRNINIVKVKPLFNNSVKYSKWITILYFLLAALMMHLVTILGRDFFLNCN